MTSQLNVALILKLGGGGGGWGGGSLMCLALSFDMLSMGVCITRHGQTSDRLVQEIKCLYCIIMHQSPISPYTGKS